MGRLSSLLCVEQRFPHKVGYSPVREQPSPHKVGYSRPHKVSYSRPHIIIGEQRHQNKHGYSPAHVNNFRTGFPHEESSPTHNIIF